VLVKLSSDSVLCNTAKNYIEVAEMDPCIEKYCKVYADDLKKRLGLTKHRLQTALAVSALLNPIFGQKPKVLWSGLLTEYHFDQARKTLST
jgi:hypothetical protein